MWGQGGQEFWRLENFEMVAWKTPEIIGGGNIGCCQQHLGSISLPVPAFYYPIFPYCLLPLLFRDPHMFAS